MPRSAAGKKRRWQRIVGNEEEADEDEDEDEDEEDNNNDNIEGVVREKFGGDAHRALLSMIRRGKEDGYAEEEAGEKDTADDDGR